jgi:hypothetical protein
MKKETELTKKDTEIKKLQKQMKMLTQDNSDWIEQCQTYQDLVKESEDRLKKSKA